MKHKGLKAMMAGAISATMSASMMLAPHIARAEPNPDVVVNARVFNGYRRTQLKDGTLKPEYYGAAIGGRWDGTMVDKSLDDLPFTKIVTTLAGPLRAQGYLPSADPNHTDLLLLVFWGVTTGADEGQYDHGVSGLLGAVNTMALNTTGPMVSAADDAFNSALMLQRMENSMRDRNNLTNAGILGYTDAYVHAQDLRRIGFAAGDTTIWELEANRYFVVLKAYDFPFARKEKKLKLLWEARYSIYERGNAFDRQLPAMTQAAARYFGRDTKGLVHRDIPEGKVEVGTPIVVEPAASAEPAGKR